MELPTARRSSLAPVMSTSIVLVAVVPVIGPDVVDLGGTREHLKTTEPLEPTASSTPTSALKRVQPEIAKRTSETACVPSPLA